MDKIKHMSVIRVHVDNVSHFGLLVWTKETALFCVKNEIKFVRTLEMLTVAFGESTMSRTQV